MTGKSIEGSTQLRTGSRIHTEFVNVVGRTHEGRRSPKRKWTEYLEVGYVPKQTFRDS